MNSGDIHSAQSIRDRYQSELSNLASYAWSTQLYPSNFPAAYLGNPATSSPQTTISSPVSDDILDATVISSTIRNAARSYTAIVNCRFRVYFNNNGRQDLVFDQTQRSLFNSSYLVSLANAGLNSNDESSSASFTTFFNSVKAQVIAAQSRYYEFSYNYCHASCHSSCHSWWPF